MLLLKYTDDKKGGREVQQTSPVILETVTLQFTVGISTPKLFSNSCTALCQKKPKCIGERVLLSNEKIIKEIHCE